MKKLDRKLLKSPLLIGLIAVVVLGLLMGKLTVSVLNQNSLVRLDRWVLEHTGAIQSPDLTQVMIIVTNLGGALLIWSLTAIGFVYLIRKKRVFEAGFVTAVMAGGWFLEVMMKNAIHRARPLPPSGTALIPAWGWSYPSGHALLSVLFYFTVAYFIYKQVEAKVIGWYSFAFALILSTLIAFSRVYLQVHYLSDVIAGLTSGLLWFAICVFLAEHYKFKA
jgi:undecaprenyl-diphosphatase